MQAWHRHSLGSGWTISDEHSWDERPGRRVAEVLLSRIPVKRCLGCPVEAANHLSLINRGDLAAETARRAHTARGLTIANTCSHYVLVMGASSKRHR